MFGNPWHRRLRTAITETKLTKKFITDEEGTDLLLPKIVAEKPPEVEPKDSTFCPLTLRLTDTLEVVRAVLCLHRMEERSNHTTTNAESESNDH